MQRRQGCQRIESIDDFRREPHGRGESAAAVDDAVADRQQAAPESILDPAQQPFRDSVGADLVLAPITAGNRRTRGILSRQVGGAADTVDLPPRQKSRVGVAAGSEEPKFKA